MGASKDAARMTAAARAKAKPAVTKAKPVAKKAVAKAKPAAKKAVAKAKPPVAKKTVAKAKPVEKATLATKAKAVAQQAVAKVRAVANDAVATAKAVAQKAVAKAKHVTLAKPVEAMPGATIVAKKATGAKGAKKVAAARKAPSAAFSSIAASLGVNEGVGVARMFGSDGLSLGRRFFCFEHDGDLVMKLPAERVAALTADGVGSPFDPGMGRPSREWLAVAPGRGDWQRLAEEALAYCGTLPPK